MRFLELARDAVVGTVQLLVDWVQGLAAAGVFDPFGWPPLVWLVLALLAIALLAFALKKRRRVVQPGVPEMMVSHGEIVLVAESDDDDDGPAYGLAAPPRAHHRLELTLSNLNPYPVQLLELAVRTRNLRMPVVAEAGSVVPPNGAVDVVAELFDLPGDAGVVELYLYSSRSGRRTFVVTAPLEWEPWAQRYRIKALALKVAPTGTLASQERRRRERRSYESAKRRERQRELAEAAFRRAEDLGRQMRDRRAAATEQRRAATSEAAAAVPMRGSREVGDEVVAETVYSGAAAPEMAAAWSGASTVATADGDRPSGRRIRRLGRASDPGASEPGDAYAQDAVPERDQAPEPEPETKPRRRLEFPDEF